MKGSRSIAVLFASCAVAGLAQTQHQHHPPQSASEYARVLDDPERDGWQKPHEVIMALKLTGKETVADIGSGTGYFANRLARHAARVFAVDIDSKLLEMSLKTAPSNVTPVLASADDPRLPDGLSDLIFFCDVVHHIENRAAYLEKVKNALKPGGRVAVIDFHKREMKLGPPPEMKIDRAEMVKEFEKAGFRLVEEQGFLAYQYFLLFSPVS